MIDDASLRVGRHDSLGDQTLVEWEVRERPVLWQPVDTSAIRTCDPLVLTSCWLGQAPSR